jgi:hypothetical protein
MWIGPSLVIFAALRVDPVGFMCLVRRLTPLMKTRSRLVSMRMTSPVWPLWSPAVTITVSPVLTCRAMV